MSNPVFNRIDKESSRGYAGFGSQPSSGQYGPPSGQYGQRSAGTQSSPYSTQGMSEAQLRDLYARPAAGPVQTGRLTVDDVIMKAALLFGIMIVVAAGTWFVGATVSPAIASMAMLVGIFVTLGLGLLIAFKKTISVPLIVTYAAVEGLLVGGISFMFETMYDGLVTTAIIATLSVFAAMFIGWKAGYIKVTAKSRRIFGMAIMGYLIFALVNLGFSLFGANNGWGIFGQGSNMGILLSVFVVGLASYSLAMDFDSIDRAVSSGAPQQYSWLLAHGLLVTVVWLYLEILRLLAHLQGRD
ncbi:Bax inhibitor-1/YccA family protein [Gephyromycinifex aptenodytis]|uniref:Bax inhibitor-1/YccA family protein n=1 Tax=Gephyromycinifex aptenodytis TaxID=2716227 RepID=UPI001445DDD9|nr:Bax inhibitor-1/YccA family protein [Gephyromycinifex aptenodytis]